MCDKLGNKHKGNKPKHIRLITGEQIHTIELVGGGTGREGFWGPWER